jgi:hypothetical protein
LFTRYLVAMINPGHIMQARIKMSARSGFDCVKVNVPF